MESAELKAFMGWFKWVLFALMIVAVILLVYFSIRSFKKKKTNPVKFISVTGIFAALSVLLYVIIPDFGLGFTPFWLKVHLDEIPMFLGGYMYGPLAAILINLVKTLIKLPISTTACVGEFGDFIFSLIFVLPAVILYEKRRKISSVFIGAGISTVAHIIFAMIFNVYVMVPFFSYFYNYPLAALEKACSAIIPAVSGENWIWMYAFVMVAPMNAIKDIIVLSAVILLYKRLHIVINRIGQSNEVIQSSTNRIGVSSLSLVYSSIVIFVLVAVLKIGLSFA